jgi:hypothetical protein
MQTMIVRITQFLSIHPIIDIFGVDKTLSRTKACLRMTYQVNRSSQRAGQHAINRGPRFFTMSPNKAEYPTCCFPKHPQAPHEL